MQHCINSIQSHKHASGILLSYALRKFLNRTFNGTFLQVLLAREPSSASSSSGYSATIHPLPPLGQIDATSSAPKSGMVITEAFLSQVFKIE